MRNCKASYKNCNSDLTFHEHGQRLSSPSNPTPLRHQRIEISARVIPSKDSQCFVDTIPIELLQVVTAMASDNPSPVRVSATTTL